MGDVIRIRETMRWWMAGVALGPFMVGGAIAMVVAPQLFATASNWSETSLRALGAAGLALGAWVLVFSAQRLRKARELTVLPDALELRERSALTARVPLAAIKSVGTRGNDWVVLVLHDGAEGVVIPERERLHVRRYFGADLVLPQMTMPAPELAQLIVERIAG
jgi:hypothetical protein